MNTHTWFSPLGDRNQAPTHMAAMMNRPMKMLHLERQRQRMQTGMTLFPAYTRGWIQAYPLAILKGLAVWRVGMMGASSIVTVWTGDDARLPASRSAYRVGAPAYVTRIPPRTDLSNSDLLSKHVLLACAS